MRDLGIRWTIGDVSAFGFEALRLSIWGAYRAFGADTEMVVFVNSLPIEKARKKTREVPDIVSWACAERAPAFLADFLDGEMAEGVAWKLAPLRAFPDRFELSLDNDCIFWKIPPTVETWLRESPPRCLIAADVKAAFGSFSSLAGSQPRNTGIRGLPPGYDLGRALQAVLQDHPMRLGSELDEQGLQAVALDRDRPAHVVSAEEVTICSPFWPHEPRLGSAGAHFVGLNSHSLPWDYYGRPASELVSENWRRLRPELCRRVGVAEEAASP